MRFIIISLLMIISVVCFGQTANVDSSVKHVGKTAKIDSLDMKVFSIRDVNSYLLRIDKVAASLKNLRLSKEDDYKQLVTELNLILAEADKKRKSN